MPKLPEFLSTAKYVATSQADQIGLHKKGKRVTQYYYYEFDYNGHTLYFNVEARQILIKKKTTMKYVVHDITGKLKSDLSDGAKSQPSDKSMGKAHKELKKPTVANGKQKNKKKRKK